MAGLRSGVRSCYVIAASLRHPFPRRDHFDAVVRKAASRAMSVREWTSSFFRMWETWVATVRRDRESLAAI